MKKIILPVCTLVAYSISSCKSEARKFEGVYNYVLSKDVNCTLPDTSYLNNENYIIEIEKKSSDKLLIKNINNQGKEVEGHVTGNKVTVNSDSFGDDAFVSIIAQGEIDDNNIELDYTITTPDCIIKGSGVSTK